MTSLTTRLKRELWRRFATADYPAEWDGIVYGGGKVSQRFWEYFKAIELLDLGTDSRLLDIGGGSPVTGLSFFPRMLAAMGVVMAVMDVNFGDTPDIPENVTLLHGLADRPSLSEAIQSFKPTHIACLSVLEHASDDQQIGIFAAVEEAFAGTCFVVTLEFHENHRYWEQMPTTETLSRAVSQLTRYHLNDIESSPIYAVNAVQGDRRMWRPLAMRFLA
jgi:hypothetical protein